ncbi:MAG: hypothetical protein HYW50_02290 [Candidatus Diapherotrites archaeon]|nr:hypothetical protein [Candidatus Diapherotrites archaeon]
MLWKVGVWAGGDVKLFTALAALNPVNYAFIGDFFGLDKSSFGTIDLPVYPLTLFVFSIFSMFPVAILVTIKGIAKRKELQKKIAGEIKAKTAAIFFSALLVSGVLTIAAVFNLNSAIAVVALILAGFFGKKITGIIGTVAFVGGAYFSGTIIIQQFAIVFFFLFFLFVLIKLYLLAKSDLLVEKIPVAELKEGMICAETILVENGKAKKIKPLSMKTVINHLQNNNVEALISNLKPKGKVLADQNAGGLTNEQIKGLKEAAKTGEIEGVLLVKKSVAFVPAVLMAYLITQTIGDALWLLIF